VVCGEVAVDLHRLTGAWVAYHRVSMADVLDTDSVRDAISVLDGWEGDRNAIRRTVTAPDFRTGIMIVDAVADVAEERNHHPDIDIRWRKVTFTLRTHSAGGVTKKDLDLAQRIDAIVAGHGAR
jgi:4a-hydroxytetrahydrobiopterin dehydratase